MFRRSPSGSGSQNATPTDPNLLQLHSLNLDFLQVLLAAQTSTDQPKQHHGLRLAEAQAKALQNSDSAALQRMAACDFSLFSLSWHRVDEWLHLAEQSARAAVEHRTAGNSGDAPSASRAADTTTENPGGLLNFMNCAVFFAWHLAQTNVQAARFMLGMSSETADVMRTMDLWQCRYIGQRYRRLLSPRWQHNRYFWPDLLRYGLSGETEHFKLVQLLGTQLMAQDLEPSAIARLCAIDPE